MSDIAVSSQFPALAAWLAFELAQAQANAS